MRILSAEAPSGAYPAAGWFAILHLRRVSPAKKRWFPWAPVPNGLRVVLRDRDVEMGNIEKLAVEYPEAAADLRTFPLPAKPKG